MSFSRRHILRILGGGFVVAAGGAGAFLGTRTPERALAPWQRAGAGYDDPRLEALSWAILAPNPHNRQPWVVRLDGERGFTLFAQTDRKLPHTDPFDRQITIGLGCFLEVARQALAARGIGVALLPFPEGEPGPTLDHRPVARVELTDADAAPDPLFQHVPGRRSCREPYDLSRAIRVAEGEALRRTAVDGTRTEFAVEAKRVARLRDLTWRAFEVELRTPRTYLESVELMRFGKAEIEASPDGIDLGGRLLETLQVAGLLDREQMMDMSSDAYRQGFEKFRPVFDGTPAFAWIVTSGNSRRAQLAAGASWVRLNLAATAAGLSLHPVSQCLQEYPEVAALLAEAQASLADAPGERVQMLGRLGYGPDVAPSPRWPLKSRMKSA